MRFAVIAATLCLASPTFSAPPKQKSVSVVLGPKLFHDGDVVEITNIRATSAQLEPGDSVTVQGRVRLESREKASLDLYLTQLEGNGREETDKSQVTPVSEGLQKFELKTTIKHRGVLHLTLYDTRTKRPFGGVYFGTAEQMRQVKDMKLGYYLEN